MRKPCLSKTKQKPEWNPSLYTLRCICTETDPQHGLDYSAVAWSFLFTSPRSPLGREGKGEEMGSRRRKGGGGPPLPYISSNCKVSPGLHTMAQITHTTVTRQSRSRLS